MAAITHVVSKIANRSILVQVVSLSYSLLRSKRNGATRSTFEPLKLSENLPMTLPIVKTERTSRMPLGIASRCRVQCQLGNFIGLQMASIFPHRRVVSNGVSKALPSSPRKDSFDITFQPLVLCCNIQVFPITVMEDLPCHGWREVDGIVNDDAPFTTSLTILTLCNVPTGEDIRKTNKFPRCLTIQRQSIRSIKCVFQQLDTENEVKVIGEAGIANGGMLTRWRILAALGKIEQDWLGGFFEIFNIPLRVEFELVRRLRWVRVIWNGLPWA